MTIQQVVDGFFATSAGQLALLIVAVGLADWALGTAAAVRDKTFTLDVWAAWLRKHVAGRIIPIWVLLILGYMTDTYVIPVLDLPALTSIGVGAAGVYALETLGSIARSWGPTDGPAVLRRDPVQPVPKE